MLVVVVIPAPRAYTNIVVVKKLVVETRMRRDLCLSSGCSSLPYDVLCMDGTSHRYLPDDTRGSAKGLL